MSQTIDYAFLPRIDAVARPRVFANLIGLARHIERCRYGQAIQLTEVEDLNARRRMATGATDAAPYGLRDRGVQIHTLTQDGGVDRSLGFAWLKGGGRDVLRVALEQAALSQGPDRRHLIHAA